MIHRTILLVTAGLASFILIIAAVAASRVHSTGSTGAPSVPTTAVTAATPSPAPASDPAGSPTLPVSPTAASAIARASVPGARIVRAPELVNAQGRMAYEVLLDQGTVYVDATSGDILASTAAAPTLAPSSGGNRTDGARRFFEPENEREDHDD
ncbi:MAG: PepSY domain-containing protein [Chloroflexi bacterium]|nr:PepSY domain-containing protein [Chloroflexota bacterium]